MESDFMVPTTSGHSPDGDSTLAVKPWSLYDPMIAIGHSIHYLGNAVRTFSGRQFLQISLDAAEPVIE
jgi:hypothetical protein